VDGGVVAGGGGALVFGHRRRRVDAYEGPVVSLDRAEFRSGGMRSFHLPC
jgi:hypothetical protein